MQCPNWDCPERNDLGCCKHTACINPKYNIKLIYSNHTIISNDEYAEYCRLKKELADLKKHGQWEIHLDAVGNMYSECSCCHTTWWDLKNGDKYCSECGAKMDGGKYT